MLTNLSALLKPAVRGGYGVASFNVFGWEDALAIVGAAQEARAPVILAANLDFTRFMPVEAIAAMLRSLAQSVSVPVCVHLDHTYEISSVVRAVDAGFTSVMYDGSQLPLEDNIEGTRRVVEHSHAAGCSVEGEIGSVPYAEGRDHIKSELTDVSQAVRLAQESGLDALAVSVGNIHRLTTPTAKVDFARLLEIRAAVSAPLVIHGSSGIPDEDLTKLAKMGVAKFNIGTCVRQAFGRGLRETLLAHPDRFDRLEIMRDVMPYVAREAGRMIRLLSSAN